MFSTTTNFYNTGNGLKEVFTKEMDKIYKKIYTFVVFSVAN